MLNNIDWKKIIEDEDRIIANSDRKYRYHCQSIDALDESLLYKQSLASYQKNECEMPENDFIQLMKNEKLKNILHHLTAKQRQAVELYFWQGYTHREIAEIINCSRQNVTELIYKALSKIKKIYLNYTLE